MLFYVTYLILTNFQSRSKDRYFEFEFGLISANHAHFIIIRSARLYCFEVRIRDLDFSLMISHFAQLWLSLVISAK